MPYEFESKLSIVVMGCITIDLWGIQEEIGEKLNWEEIGKKSKMVEKYTWHSNDWKQMVQGARMVAWGMGEKQEF